MKDIQPFGFVFFKHLGHNWIDGNFNGAITRNKDQCSQVKQATTICQDGNDNGRNVTGKGKDHRLSIIDLINDQAEEDNGYGKRPHSHSQDGHPGYPYSVNNENIRLTFT